MNTRQLAALVQADIPVQLWDDPGTGKTKFTAALARALAQATGIPYQMHTEILSQCDPTDFGIPREQDGKMVRLPLDWIVKAVAHPTILFFDEFSLAPRTVLAATLTLIQDRRIADRQLHKDTRIILASNPAEFTGMELLPQQSNRMAHIDFSALVPLADWARGMLAGFPDLEIPKLPEAWQASIPKHRALVASFITRFPTEGFRRPKELGKAWPSRRTWDMAATACAAVESIREDDSLPTASLVGEGPALQYIQWRNQQDIPDFGVLLADAANHPLPDEDTKLFVILSGCAAHTVANPSQKLWDACWQVCGRAIDMGKADISTIAARVLVENDKKFKGCRLPKVAEKLIPILRASGV